MSEVMIQADGLVKIYKSKQTEVLALQGLDLTVEKGDCLIQQLFFQMDSLSRPVFHGERQPSHISLQNHRFLTE